MKEPCLKHKCIELFGASMQTLHKGSSNALSHAQVTCAMPCCKHDKQLCPLSPLLWNIDYKTEARIDSECSLQDQAVSISSQGPYGAILLCLHMCAYTFLYPSLLLLPGFTDRVVYSLNDMRQAVQSKQKPSKFETSTSCAVTSSY